MSLLTTPPRTASPHAAAVLERLAAEKRVTLETASDRKWLTAITPHYGRLLSRMEDRQALYRLRGGQYVVAPRGSKSIEQAASTETLVDLTLRGHGPYYVGFLSALIAHGLTDLHSTTTYVAITDGNTLAPTTIALPGTTVRLVRLSASRWPQESDGQRERVRALAGHREFYWRASAERALVDAIMRPELSGGIETVVSAWARAARTRPELDWGRLWVIASPMGLTAQRRVAFLLRLVGKGVVAEHDAGGSLRKARSVSLFDRTDAFGLSSAERVRDPSTGLTLNVPERDLRGWVAAADVI